jgi:hypothetical protein
MAGGECCHNVATVARSGNGNVRLAGLFLWAVLGSNQ